MTPLNVTEDTWWTIFGAILAIIGCIFQAIGFIMQKMGHIQIEKYNKKMSPHAGTTATEQMNSNSAITNINPAINLDEYEYEFEYDASNEDDDNIRSPMNQNRKPSTCDIKNKNKNKNNKTKYKRINKTKKTKITKTKLSKTKQFKKKKYIQSRLWLLGFFLNGVVGSLFNIIALNYAPQSIVLPLSATTLVGNTILATKYLGESFPINDFVGVLLVIIGSIITIIFGPKESHNRSNTINFVPNYPFMIFFCLLSFIILIDFILLQIFSFLNKKKKSSLIDRGVNKYGDIEINPNDHNIIYNRSFFLISYPLISAYFASISFLVIKSMVQIVDSSTQSTKSFIENFSYYLTYIYIIGIILVNFLLEMYRQKGLRSFGAVYVIPIYQVLVITIGTSMGAIYFNEMKHMSLSNIIIFILSVCITCFGVIILALSDKINNYTKNMKNCYKYLLQNSNNNKKPRTPSNKKYNQNTNNIAIDIDTNTSSCVNSSSSVITKSLSNTDIINL